MLSWEAWAVRAREKVGTAAGRVFWGQDDLGTSKRFGLSSAALGQQVEVGAVTGEGARCVCALSAFQPVGREGECLLSVAREGSRLAQAARSGDVVRAHAAVAAVERSGW